MRQNRSVVGSRVSIPHIGLEDVVAVARRGSAVALAADAREAMESSAQVVAGLVGTGDPVYGVSTGFGSLATVAIPHTRREDLQRALIRSHAAGDRGDDPGAA